MDENQAQLFYNMVENPRYLEEQIITYLGNKRALLPFIGQGINYVRQRLNKDKLSIVDLFSGSGIVSRYFKQFANRLIVNDLELYSKTINSCYLANKSQIDFVFLENIYSDLLKLITVEKHTGFISELYSPRNEESITISDRVFYTKRNATYIDTARYHIDSIPESYKPYFLAPLLYEASVHTNTSGVFKGFYKSADGIGQFGGQGKNALSRILKDINLQLPIFSNFECDYTINQMDACSYFLSHNDEVDLLYLDPPYNQHPYGSNYFMLNLITKYERPEQISGVSGIPENWNRSNFNKKQSAFSELFSIIRNCNAKFILISYNSEGFISQQEFIDELNKIGIVKTFETRYNTFRGSRNLMNRSTHVTEYLYLVEKKYGT